MRRLLLDTNAMIFISNGERITGPARDAVTAALEAEDDLLVSPWSAWEVGIQAARGRFALTQRPDSWFGAFVGRPGFALAPLTPSVLIASSFLPGTPPKDPSDRVMAATAREFGFCLVTRDRQLLDYADAGHINAIEC